MEVSSKTIQTKSHSLWFVPWLIFAVALLVRVIGLDFGFPFLTHPDESYFMDPLRNMSIRGGLDSGLCGYPAIISFYSKYAWVNLWSLIRFGTNYGVAYAENVQFFYYVTRCLTAIQGSLIPVVAWLIGKQYKKNDFSLPAAFLFTFYPPFIVHSMYITVDIPLTLFVMTALLFCLKYLNTHRWHWLILACLMTAFSTLEKYPGILTLGIVLVAIRVAAYQKIGGKESGWGVFLKTVVFSLIVTGLFIYLLAPQLFHHWDQVSGRLQEAARTIHPGADGLGWAGNLWFYAKQFVSQAGWAVSALAVAGCVIASTQKDPANLLLFFGFGYWVVVSRLGLHWPRWSLPMMISPLLLGGFAVIKLWQALPQRKLFKGVMIVGLAIIGFLYLLNGFSTSVVLSWKDSRVEGLEYLELHAITPENSVSEGYTPFNSQNLVTIFDFDLEQRGDIRYVILSSSTYSRFEAEPERYKAENAFYANLRRKAELMKVIEKKLKPTSPLEQAQITWDYLNNLLQGTESRYRSGPEIQIYRLR